jgi:penicillin-binding protein 2
VVQEIKDQDGVVRRRTEPERMATLDVRPEHLTMVREALADVVSEGTGRKAKNAAFPVAGKTGTAQVVKRSLGIGEKVKEQHRDHNWFACYVSNGEEPVLAMTVFLENGGKEGMAIKAEIAGRIIAAYLPLVYPERAALYTQIEEEKKAAAAARRKSAPRKPVAAEVSLPEDETPPPEHEGVSSDD